MVRPRNAITVLCFLVNSINSQEAEKTSNLINGLLPVYCTGDYVDGVPVFSSSEDVKLYIFGNKLSENITLGLSKKRECDKIVDTPIKMSVIPNTRESTAIISFITPPTYEFFFVKARFYLCVKDSKSSSDWKYPGFDDKVSFYVYEPILIPSVTIILIIVCFLISALMSGLNIGLMALDPHELMVIKNSGTKKEKKYANAIYSVRRNGNYLLCSILITATLCNSVATVSIDNIVTNWVAVLITTMIIVFFCEILPQSVCTYFPLFIGYYTIYITKACMVITAPVSYPLSKLLNLILGKEIAAKVTKERLKELLKVSELPTHEERIISGTLDLNQKKVEDVMTIIDDVFTLPITAVMDFDTIALILESGYSRIPIYVRNKSNITYVLLTKDLALLDPDDKVPVKVLVQNSKHSCQYIPAGTTLDEVLKIFKGSRGHMAFVVETEDSVKVKDKTVIGIVTFEDVIEEIFQSEINDETDTFSDNRYKRRLSTHLESNNLIKLLSKYSTRASAPSENLKLAAFHFLSEIDKFSPKYISPAVLLSLLSLDIYYSAPGKKKPQDNIYVQGVPVDYFVMILEGEMELKIGGENLKLEAGAFKYFGIDVLKINSFESFIPEYSLQAIKQTLYLKITPTIYNAAVLASKFEKTKVMPDINTKSELYKYFKLIIGS